MANEEAPRLEDALRALERAGIAANDGDRTRLAGFLRRLRPEAAPATETDPWALPVTRGWPRE